MAAESVKMTAYEWLTSERQAAKKWRSEATMGAYNAVLAIAEVEKQGELMTVPAKLMERPDTGQSAAKGQFMNIPDPEAERRAVMGQFVIIPGKKGQK
jgi:hypothetical protein